VKRDPQDLADCLAARPGERVLDAGCGAGLASARLAASGARVTGVDSNPVVLEQARLAAPEASFVCAGILAWNGAEEFDAILAGGLLHWLPAPSYGLDRLARLLRPGGRLVAETGGAGAPALAAKTLDAALKQAGFGRVEWLPAPEGRIRIRAWRPE
jgi:trans-aconitate methyltransferase